MHTFTICQVYFPRLKKTIYEITDQHDRPVKLPSVDKIEFKTYAEAEKALRQYEKSKTVTTGEHMTNEVIKHEGNPIAEIEQTQRLVAQLMKTPHYAKMGETGIFTIVQMARSIGIDVLDALNGDMYFVNGKVELSARAMNYLIRQKGHSITKDDKSSKTVCILHGKRKDNGDTWSITFSIDDAKKAGIYKSTWEKYPEDMLFARALTRLARQLFPDVIKGCYISGEMQDIGECEIIDAKPQEIIAGLISMDQARQLADAMAKCSETFRAETINFLKGCGISSYEKVPIELYKNLMTAAELQLLETQEVDSVSDNGEEEDQIA